MYNVSILSYWTAILFGDTAAFSETSKPASFSLLFRGASPDALVC